MNQYGWTPAYVAAIEEHDRVVLQQRIGAARQLMSERLSRLISHPMTHVESEEFRRLCDCRRALDLLERVSNDIDLFPAQEYGRSA
jgi:hypothetical protein